MIEDPLIRDILCCYFEVLLVVNIPADLILLPFDRVYVKIILEAAGGDDEGCCSPFLTAVISRGMDSSVDTIRFLSDVFHNVNFARARPALAAYIFTEHPEGRPDPLSVWKFHPRFNATILSCLQPLTLNPRRGIWATTKCCFLLTGFDHQHSILDTYIFRPIGISLPFLITPTVATDIKGPVFQ